MNDSKQILIFSGVLSTFTEMTFVGHIIEQIKIVKQATGNSYPSILKDIKQDFRANGMVAFYRGYYPWGVLQCVKGAPVLFVQDIVNNNLQTNYGHILSKTSNEDQIKFRSNIIGGLCGGFSQALFLTPLQRLKTEVMTSNNITPFLFENAHSGAFSSAKSNGSMRIENAQRCKISLFNTNNLYKGFLATSSKRALDWGFRFAGIAEFKEQFPEFSETNTGRFVGGIFGGLCSLVTTPLEVIIAIIQKHQSLHTNSFQIIKDIGIQQLTRGMCFKALDSCYHTSMIMLLSPLYTKLIQQITEKNEK
jgi:hypothetical protein